MKKRLITILALALTAVFIVFAVTNWWVYRPGRVTSEFVGHLSHERYEEAALMLSAPSAIEVASDGGLTVVDHAGNSATVQEARLPFLSGGGEPDGPGDFSMTALRGAKDGQADQPVVIYLGLDGGKIRIERVDTL
jgi:hypothetical protein